jgi:hypothetical protein
MKKLSIKALHMMNIKSGDRKTKEQLISKQRNSLEESLI